jgi:hypothetical protein
LVSTFAKTRLTLFRRDAYKMKIKARWIKPNERKVQVDETKNKNSNQCNIMANNFGLNS